MKVYRYLSQKEFFRIINNQIDELGNNFSESSLSNTHKYKKGVKYMHFFRKLSDLSKLQMINGKENMILCEFNIPLVTLLRHSGKGFYEPHGYDYYYDTMREYAIPVSEFNLQFLSSYAIDYSGKITSNEAEYFLNENRKEIQQILDQASSIKEK